MIRGLVTPLHTSELSQSSIEERLLPERGPGAADKCDCIVFMLFSDKRGFDQWPFKLLASLSSSLCLKEVNFEQYM